MLSLFFAFLFVCLILLLMRVFFGPLFSPFRSFRKNAKQKEGAGASIPKLYCYACGLIRTDIDGPCLNCGSNVMTLSEDITLGTQRYRDTEADGMVYCGKCGKAL